MNILIIEPNESFSQELIELLHHSNPNYPLLHFVTHRTARSGWEYLMASAEKIDLLITEISLNHPEISGLDILEETKYLFPEIPVAIITDLRHTFLRTEAERLKADGFFYKHELRRTQLLVWMKICTAMFSEEKMYERLRTQHYRTTISSHRHATFLPAGTVLSPQARAEFMMKLYGTPWQE